MAARLAEETGITLPQAAELIHLLGENWTSLLREARAINLGTAEPRDL